MNTHFRPPTATCRLRVTATTSHCYTQASLTVTDAVFLGQKHSQHASQIITATTTQAAQSTSLPCRETLAHAWRLNHNAPPHSTAGLRNHTTLLLPADSFATQTD